MSGLDLFVIGGLLILVTVVGRRAAGEQKTRRDFYLGGRRLPWWAVSASIVATEISAVTYISLPATVFREGGNLTYLQIALLGYVPARLFVGLVLAPAYYEREIMSPYEYVGLRLGAASGRMATGLFMLGGVLAQASRVYLSAVVLDVLWHDRLARWGDALGLSSLVLAMILLAGVAALWAVLGGVATVVWTDAMLFLFFLVGAAVTLVASLSVVSASPMAVLAAAAEAGKLHFLDFSLDWTQPYTVWSGLIGAFFGGVAAFGCDQLVAQRLFSCRGPREARKAIIGSTAGVVVTIAVLFVGVALWSYYLEHPLSADAALRVAERSDRILPMFIVDVLPAGLRGLVVAGALAAAISSLDSILAALAQSTESLLRSRSLVGATSGSPPPRPSPGSEQDQGLAAYGGGGLALSRFLVVFWAVILVGVAILLGRVADRFAVLLDLSLSLAGYVGGALLAAVLLALWPAGRDGRGYQWSAPFSVLVVVCFAWHAAWTAVLVALAGAAVVLHWWRGVKSGRATGSGIRLAVLYGIWGLSYFVWFKAVDAQGRVLAWPWYVPVGALVAYFVGWMLSEPRAASPIALPSAAPIALPSASPIAAARVEIARG